MTEVASPLDKEIAFFLSFKVMDAEMQHYLEVTPGLEYQQEEVSSGSVRYRIFKDDLELGVIKLRMQGEQESVVNAAPYSEELPDVLKGKRLVLERRRDPHGWEQKQERRRQVREKGKKRNHFRSENFAAVIGPLFEKVQGLETRSGDRADKPTPAKDAEAGTGNHKETRTENDVDELAEAYENLRLIQARKSQYVQETDIPLQLIKDERRWLKRIEELEQRIKELE
jgi:hypothetical protein